MGHSETSSRVVKVSSYTCHCEINSYPSLTSQKPEHLWHSCQAALFAMVKPKSFHIATIGTCVLSSRASLIIINFCKLDDVLDGGLNGGLNGGKGLADVERSVGFVIAEAMLALL